MKKYEKATIDVIVLDEKDAITTSGRYTSWDGNWGGADGDYFPETTIGGEL